MGEMAAPEGQYWLALYAINTVGFKLIGNDCLFIARVMVTTVANSPP